MTETNYFRSLNAIDVNDHTEQKASLTYLSWAWAWSEIKSLYPDTTYTVYENAQGWNYHTDGRTCWVKTGVTCNGIEHIEYLPVMDHRNRSIPLESVTSFDVNKAIQRSLTKAVARHGLGLYIYAGEDLPEPEDGVKRLGDESNALYRQFVAQGYDKALVTACMREACSVCEVTSPREVPAADKAGYTAKVKALLDEKAGA